MGNTTFALATTVTLGTTLLAMIAIGSEWLSPLERQSERMAARLGFIFLAAWVMTGIAQTGPPFPFVLGAVCMHLLLLESWQKRLKRYEQVYAMTDVIHPPHENRVDQAKRVAERLARQIMELTPNERAAVYAYVKVRLTNVKPQDKQE